MTNREKIQAIFNGDSVEGIVVSIRIDLWHNQLLSEGNVPAEIEGMDFEEVEDYLGFARSARFRSYPSLTFEGGEYEKQIDGENISETFKFESRTLSRHEIHTEEQKKKGMKGHVTEYPLKAEDDYKALCDNLASAKFEFKNGVEEFKEYDAATGDKGLPQLCINACPAHRLMLDWAGYENFYFHMMDFPETVDKTIAALDKVYRQDIWQLALDCPAEIINHGAHFSSQMTPPPIFEQYFKPYFKEFNNLMHNNDKKVLWHSDAEMSALLDAVLELGFDSSDCLATDPLVDTTLEDYINTWQGKIICWGGLPSVIFDPSYPMADYKKYIDKTVKIAAERNDVILGASDNVMPGAEWERLIYLRDAVS
ncbi:MAG: hypothetical protein ACYTFY_15065 [Planctomycetota bacterium]|jgi:hypothetical protein